MKKKALICGVSGQDGSYLAKYLMNYGYEIIGTSRDAQINPFINLQRLGIKEEIKLISMATKDSMSILEILEHHQPSEIYHLGGQSSVGLSFDQPLETLESISSSTLYLLEAIRRLNKNTKLFVAGSSECFGDNLESCANESTPLKPKSPYAVAKTASFWLAKNYRETYGVHSCTGIMFNHESPLRHERFVTQKIVKSACRIKTGTKEKLTLGNLDIVRDWGWAPEYIEAMFLMLQQESPSDYVIATGESNTLREFVAAVFDHLNLDWQEHVIIDSRLIRPNELRLSRANPSMANKALSWFAKTKMKETASKMVEAEISGKLHQ